MKEDMYIVHIKVGEFDETNIEFSSSRLCFYITFEKPENLPNLLYFWFEKDQRIKFML